MTNPRSTSLDELERQSRVAETEQVVLVGDGAGPPAMSQNGIVQGGGGQGADGDGE